jgi:hypothetical protein
MTANGTYAEIDNDFRVDGIWGCSYHIDTHRRLVLAEDIAGPGEEVGCPRDAQRPGNIRRPIVL